MHGSRDHGEGFGFHCRWPTGLFFPTLSFVFHGAGRMRLRGCYEGTFSRSLLRSLDACRGGTAKRLEMQLRTALWGEKHCQPRQETPSSAEREFGTEKHAQCKKKQTLNIHLPVRVTFESHSAFAMTEPGTPHLGTPSPERPTASVSTSDSNSLRRSVERLFKRPMAAKGGGALTSTASAATENTSKSASKQPVVSTEIAASPELRRGTTAPPLSERELAPTHLSHDARYETLKQTTPTGGWRPSHARGTWVRILLIQHRQLGH